MQHLSSKAKHRLTHGRSPRHQSQQPTLFPPPLHPQPPAILNRAQNKPELDSSNEPSQRSHTAYQTKVPQYHLKSRQTHPKAKRWTGSLHVITSTPRSIYKALQNVPSAKRHSTSGQPATAATRHPQPCPQTHSGLGPWAKSDHRSKKPIAEQKQLKHQKLFCPVTLFSSLTVFPSYWDLYYCTACTYCSKHWLHCRIPTWWTVVQGASPPSSIRHAGPTPPMPHVSIQLVFHVCKG